jgi:cysteine synthase
MAVGIGLALMTASRGYRCVLTVPGTTDEHMLQLLRTLGAEVIPCPAVPPTDEQHYIREAQRAAQQTAGAALLSPCDHLDENSHCHHDTTAPEILRQTDGLLDAFVCAGDTGGALAGVCLYTSTQRTAVLRVEESSRG